MNIFAASKNTYTKTSHMENKIIGSKIAEARKKLSLSQAQLAQRLFISPQAVGKWERGESFPDIITFNRLAKIFGVDLNYFSENFQSVTHEMTPEQSLVKQTPEFPSEIKKNSLRWDMSRGNWVDADFSGLKNLQDKFSSSNLKNCKFVESNLSGLLLKSNTITHCDFLRSDISYSRVRTSNIFNNLFSDCSLIETEFTGSSIKSCNFSKADLTGVVIKSCSFAKNTMEKAILKRTSFNGTAIADIVFDCIIEDCSFENCSFTRVTFQNSTLTNTFFKNKSLKRIQFINCQADQLTYAFLKNGKADLTGITLISS